MPNKEEVKQIDRAGVVICVATAKMLVQNN